MEQQLANKDSLLDLVKQLVKLRTENPEFSDVSNLKVLADGYPFVYERTVAGKKFLIALNPADRACGITIPPVQQIIVAHNVNMEKNLLQMGGISCMVAEIL